VYLLRSSRGWREAGRGAGLCSDSYRRFAVARNRDVCQDTPMYLIFPSGEDGRTSFSGSAASLMANPTQVRATNLCPRSGGALATHATPQFSGDPADEV